MRNLFFEASTFNQPIDAWGEKIALGTDLSGMFGAHVNNPGTAFNQSLRSFEPLISEASTRTYKDMLLGATSFDWGANFSENFLSQREGQEVLRLLGRR
ncbi:unnamed protein product [Amoebophrya sp. A120]|nr:unnamed protein product [Amoebophrya sp. A120]|eukprot:GSA120T00023836001.1